ncbi:MAG: hypothetical protein OXD40_02225 [bacterium]|nr:hypothetical protein [bacterium]
MKDRQDLEDLARDFVELWQEHLATTLSDPALAQWATMWLAGMPHDATATGTAATADAPDALGERLDDLASRIARCEERLDLLEQQCCPAGGTTESRPSRR